MRRPGTTARLASTAVVGDGGRLGAAHKLADEVRQDWRCGVQPDVKAMLASHPEVAAYRSVVLDLAHEEYLWRRRAGESLSPEEFARRFPGFEQSLVLLIAVRSLLAQDPELQGLLETVVWPQPGETFLGFELVREIGRGTFGRVFLAVEPALGGRHVALKIAPHGGREAEVLGRLRHPNIVPVYSVQTDETTGLTAFCMPYLGCATLCDMLDRGFAAATPPRSARVVLEMVQGANADLPSTAQTLPHRFLRRGPYVDGAIHLAAELADALAHAHEQGVYHRDLKPSNVLLSPEGRPLLLDFNLSADERLPVWRIGGTLPYMAPEELVKLLNPERADEGRSYDPRSDVFSLGVIVYQLLAGSLPFGLPPEGASVEESAGEMRRRQAGGPHPVRERNRQVDQGVARLLESCLAEEPARRPKSARELAAALRRQLGLRRRAGRWIRSHRWGVSGLAAVLLTACISVAVGLAARPPYSVRQFERAAALIEHGEYEPAKDCLDEALRADPDYEDALAARADLRMAAKDYTLALEDLRALYRLSSSGKSRAGMAYCVARLKQHEVALEYYRQALDLGYDSPALRSNAGFSYLQLGRLPEAEGSLKKAIAGDAGLSAAHDMLVVVFLNRLLRGEDAVREAVSVAEQAAAHAVPCAELHRDIAALYAVAARREPAFRKVALKHLERAVDLGAAPRQLLAQSLFSALRSEEAYGRLSSRKPGPAVGGESDHLVPLWDTR